MGRLPDFVIVGFPKCGTHALLRNLGTHPDVFTHPDEVGFFGRDRMTLDAYRDLFETDKRLAGEKSATYVLRSEAMRHMARVVPDVRIVVAVRHPIHMLHSFYNFRVWEYENGFTPGFDGARFPLHDIVLQELVVSSVGLEAADFARWIEQNVLTSFSRDRVHFAVQEQFWHDPQGSYDSLHAFLGVSRIPVEFREVNSRVSGADLYPFVDYEHPDYRPALDKMIRFDAERRGALSELIGGEPPEWRRYDALYAGLVSG